MKKLILLLAILISSVVAHGQVKPPLSPTMVSSEPVSCAVNRFYKLRVAPYTVWTGGAAGVCTVFGGSSSPSFPLSGGSGTAGAPTYSFTSDGNTGVFNPSADALGFSTAGVERWDITSTGMFVPFSSGSYDIGTSSLKVRDFHLGRNFVLYGSTSGSVAVSASATGGNITFGNLTITNPAGAQTAVLSTSSSMLLAAQSVNLNEGTGAKQPIYTCPANRKCVVTNIIVQHFSGSGSAARFTFGWDAGATGFGSVVDISAFGVSSTSILNLALGDIANGQSFISQPTPRGSAAEVLGLKVDTPEGSALTAIVHVFGYLTDNSGVAIPNTIAIQ
jgi:hypothetical protein